MVAKTNIRKAKEEDIDILLELFEKHAIYEKADFSYKDKKENICKYLFEKEAFYCQVLEVDGQVVAYITYMRQFSTWDASFYLYMDCLFIEELHRKKGFGKLLMNKVKEEAKRLDCSLIQWQTPSFNTKAIKFYEKIGAKAKTKERFFLEID